MRRRELIGLSGDGIDVPNKRLQTLQDISFLVGLIFWPSNILATVSDHRISLHI